MTEVSPLIRAALFVADLDRSVSFYTDVLGWQETFFSAELRDRVINELLGMPDAAYTRVRILKQSGPSFGMIGLFEISNPAPPVTGRSDRSCNIGEICMVFYCSDIDAIQDRLRAHGVDIIAAPRLLKIKEIPGAGQREMTCRGPDGEMLNFIERDPGDAMAPGLG